MVKPLSLLLSLALLSTLAASTPPPDLIDSLSAAQPHARRAPGPPTEAPAPAPDPSASVFPQGKTLKQSAPVRGGHRTPSGKLVHRDLDLNSTEAALKGAGNETLVVGKAVAVEAGEKGREGWKVAKNETETVILPAAEKGAAAAWKFTKNETTTVIVPGVEKGAKAGWKELGHLVAEARNETRTLEKAYEAHERKEEAEEENAKKHSIVASSTAPSPISRLPPAPPAKGPPRPSGYLPLPGGDRNTTHHVAPLDHERLARRLRKRDVVDDVRSVREQVEAKLGIETRTAELVRESGKVTGDRNHYWYVDPSPAEDTHKAAHAASSASASAKASAAAERIARQEKDKRAALPAPQGGRAGFEAARAKALEAQRSVRAQRATRTATGEGGSPTMPLLGGTGKAAKSLEGEMSRASKSASKSASKAAKTSSKEAVKSSSSASKASKKEHDKRAESTTAGFVTSTRPSSPSSAAAAASPAATSSSSSADTEKDEGGSLLDPSTWGGAISDEASSTYDSLKKKVEQLDLLSKIGLASLVLSSFLLLCALLYCCCKLRLRRRRRRAAERVNEKMMRAAQRENRGAAGGSGRSFDDRATAIPMRSFGSASGPSGADAKDKKGKRRGSWKAFD